MQISSEKSRQVALAAENKPRQFWECCVLWWKRQETRLIGLLGVGYMGLEVSRSGAPSTQLPSPPSNFSAATDQKLLAVPQPPPA